MPYTPRSLGGVIGKVNWSTCRLLGLDIHLGSLCFEVCRTFGCGLVKRMKQESWSPRARNQDKVGVVQLTPDPALTVRQ
jgi:hypothetical protein